MKPVDIKSSTYINFTVEINDKAGDNARNTFAKGHTPNWSEQAFVINKC